MLLPTQLGYVKLELLLFSLMCSLYEMHKWEGVVALHHCIPGVICKCHTLVKAVSFYTWWNCVLAILQVIIINYAPLCVHGQLVVVVFFMLSILSCYIDI